jgi:hypothetical protein
MSKAGALEKIAPKVWHTAWNVHSQATPSGHTAFKYLAPYVFKVAISNRRIVSLRDRTVTFSYRKPRSARRRTTQLDAIEFMRRFLQHVLPSGFMKVRHFGFMNANCAVKTDALGHMIARQQQGMFKPTPVEDPAPWVPACPACGGPLLVVIRLWSPQRAFLDTG